MSVKFLAQVSNTYLKFHRSTNNALAPWTHPRQPPSQTTESPYPLTTTECKPATATYSLSSYSCVEDFGRVCYCSGFVTTSVSYISCDKCGSITTKDYTPYVSLTPHSRVISLIESTTGLQHPVLYGEQHRNVHRHNLRLRRHHPNTIAYHPDHQRRIRCLPNNQHCWPGRQKLAIIAIVGRLSLKG